MSWYPQYSLSVTALIGAMSFSLKCSHKLDLIGPPRTLVIRRRLTFLTLHPSSPINVLVFTLTVSKCTLSHLTSVVIRLRGSSTWISEPLNL